MFEKDNQIFIEPDDYFEVIAGALDLYLSDQAAVRLKRVQDGGSEDDSWHETTALVADVDMLEHSESIPWKEDKSFELSATREQLIAGFMIAFKSKHLNMLDVATSTQRLAAIRYARTLKNHR